MSFHQSLKGALALSRVKIGKWPPRTPDAWEYGVKARLPEHYRRRKLALYHVLPKPVHYIPDPRKYKLDSWGVRKAVQNVPIPTIHVKQADDGLWGGEGIVVGYSKVMKKEKPRVPKFYMPCVKKYLYYSEILNKHLALFVTERARDLIDESYGLDHYILKTREVDLKSDLGMRLKGEMLVALIKNTLYPGDPVMREKVYKKYEKYTKGISEEEAEWIGLSVKEACLKQLELEKEEQIRNTIPLKKIFTQELIQELSTKDSKDDSEKSSTWIRKLNPFKSKDSGESNKSKT